MLFKADVPFMVGLWINEYLYTFSTFRKVIPINIIVVADLFKEGKAWLIVFIWDIKLDNAHPPILLPFSIIRCVAQTKGVNLKRRQGVVSTSKVEIGCQEQEKGAGCDK